MTALVEAGFRVITYDLRGFGDSDTPEEQYTVATLCEDLEAVRAGMDLAQLHLVGHSLGGMVALEYAITHPERVLSLFLASTSGHHGRRASAFSRVASQLSWLGFDAAMADPRVAEEVQSVVSSVAPWIPAIIDSLRAMTEKPDPSRALAWGALPEFSTLSRSHRIQCPTLVTHGSADMMIPFAAGERLGENIPHAQWVPIRGGRHNLPTQLPEEVNGLLLEFLQAQA